MLNIIKYPERKTWTEILKRPTVDSSLLEETVSAILKDVKENGDAAVKKYALSFGEGWGEATKHEFAEAEKNATFKELVLKAVPEDKRTHPKALDYPFEELATIQSMDTDIKVGPPYEKKYDEPAREYASVVGFNKYIAIQLTKGFPFGNPELLLPTFKEIEEFGLLPYKKTSKGLSEYRIDPLNDDLEKTQTLIKSTTDQRALLDLLLISKLAKRRLDGDPSFYVDSVVKKSSLDNLQHFAYYFYKECIYTPLHQ